MSQQPEKNPKNYHKIKQGEDKDKIHAVPCVTIDGVGKFAQSCGVALSSQQAFFETFLDNDYGAMLNFVDREGYLDLNACAHKLGTQGDDLDGSTHTIGNPLIISDEYGNISLIEPVVEKEDALKLLDINLGNESE